ncbi:CHAD domain-containing protein [Tunturibacter empetritectus]|uniref:CHAD domain-containing protein n=1 Tax=Tunturiibacter empetritectus TaxID=3069691 RepID=A0AAU7ZGN6_9BACT
MPQPVIIFLRYSLILKAAMADCLEDPKPEVVHRLRSSNRRLEAVLELLTASADLPALPKRSRAFKRSVQKTRRIAGDVRDLDVQLELLRAYQTSDGATKLEKELAVSRKKKVKKLLQQISADEDKIRHALDRLEMIFAGIADFKLSGGRLFHVARSWLTPAVQGLDPHEDDDLHSIRKACKTARYIAEIGGEESRTAMKFAKHMENIQQTTGAWHDYLLLLDQAQTRLPDGSRVIKKLYAKAALLRRQAEAKAAHLLRA